MLIKLVAAIAVFSFCICSSASKAGIVLAPPEIALGKVQPNTATQVDVKIAVTDATQQYELSQPVVTPTTGVTVALSGMRATKTNPVTLKLTFASGTSPATTKAVISLSYRKVEGINDGPPFGSFDIPFSAETVCAIGSADCNPNEPLCNANEHNPIQYLKVSQSTISDMANAQSAHRRLHNGGDSSYSMDFDFLFKVSGLARFFTLPPACPTGAPQCTQKCDCVSAFSFEHIAGAPRVASFKWTGTARTYSTPANLPDWQLDFSVPADISGFAVVTAGYDEFFFDVASRPTMIVRYRGQPIYDGPIACFSARTTRAQMKNPGATGVRPRVDLIVER